MDKSFSSSEPMNVNISNVFSPKSKIYFGDYINGFGEDGIPLVEMEDNENNKE